MVARPGWQTLMDRTGLKRSTIARYLALFNSWGLLGRVRRGSTWRTRGCDIDDKTGNLAGEYVICVPEQVEHHSTISGSDAEQPVEETRTPSLASRREPEKPLTHARETSDPEPTTNLWPIGRAPQTRRDQLHASKRLIDQLPVFRDRTARYVRSIFRDVYAAGWSPAQIAHALDHTPAGVAYWHTEQVRHPAAWAKNRLNAWQREDGMWVTPPVKLGAGRTTDLEHQDVAELAQAPRLEAEQTTAHASVARQALATVRARLTRKQSEWVGLGVSLPDANGRITATTEAPDTYQAAGSSGDDWLLRNAAAAARGVA
ncbi:hypothetical protein NE236_41870 [Actinoallomurus purpureus]|nr:hypothetical protein [Actinoallomurus purpureus]